MDLARRMQEKDSTDKLGNNDTLAEDQKSGNEVSSFNECRKDSEVKTLLQAIVDIL